MNESRLQYLTRALLDDTCTPAELQEFWQHIQSMNDEEPIKQELEQVWQAGAGSHENTPPGGWDNTLRRIYQAADAGKEKPPIVRMSKRARLAAAAAILFILGAGGYFLFLHKNAVPAGITKTAPPPQDIHAPASSRAMITLAGGQKIYLDSAVNGAVAMQGNMRLVKLANDRVVYETGMGKMSDKTALNTLDNPRGSRVVNITLADGSKVWLNAGSSITYPVTFSGNKRNVSITGEAYFEIMHNTAQPFTVKKGAMEITVLGTHFNVNSYDDESDIKVTLEQGAVKVSKGNATGVLKPGQQARVTDVVKLVDDIDMEAVLAWKNGYFQFDRASLQDVLKQLVRWYDVSFVYEGKLPPRTFTGEIERNLSLLQVLKILEKNQVHFRVEGKTIAVTP